MNQLMSNGAVYYGMNKFDQSNNELSKNKCNNKYAANTELET